MEKINGRIDMETKESVPTVGSVYNSFTDEQKSEIHFLAGCVIEKIEDENKYEDFKTNVLHVDRLSDYIYPVPLIWSDSNPDTNCDNTLGSVFKSFNFDQKTVIAFLIGNIIMGITDEEEYESLKQNTSHVKYLRDERVLKGFVFLNLKAFTIDIYTYITGEHMNVTENRVHVNPDKFFEIIAENGLNISELSERVGCSRPSIYRALNSHRMTRSFYQKIMEVVDISECTYPSTTTDIKSLNDLYARLQELENRVEILEHRL